MSDGKLMQYSTQQTQRYANQAKSITSIYEHVSVCSLVQLPIAAYFIKLLSLLEKKETQRNSFERVENTIPLFLAIIILHDW